MGTYVIRMPDIGEGIAEVELVKWHVKPGDMVADEQSLADVMTDKANVEIPSHVAGNVADGATVLPALAPAPPAEPVRAAPAAKAAAIREAPVPREAAPGADKPDK